jgi:hypothetical protein
MLRVGLLSLLVAVPALAELSADDIAAIQQEQAKAAAAVEDKYKDKTSPSDLRAKMKESAAAQRAVLDSRGVKPAEWARASATMNADTRAAVEAKKKASESKPAEAGKKPGAASSAQQDADAAEAAAMDQKMGLGTGKKK